MRLAWFDARAEAGFGVALAEFIVERLPDADSDKAKLQGQKWRELFQKLCAQIDRFKQGRKMNFYKKAKLGNAFRWKMIDAGYASDFVDEVTREILLRL